MSFNLTGVPQCGVSCLVSSLSTSSCALTDYTCLCLDKVYNDAVTNCVILGCAVKEQLVVKRITATNCNLPIIDRGPIVTLLQIVVTIIQDVFFFIRVLSRILKLAPWGPDDTTIVVAFVLQNVFLAGGIIANQNGLGMDIWFVPFNQITNFLQIFFVFEVLYTITIGIIKISITFLYLRLFPERRIRRFLWATQIFNVTLVGVFVIVDLAQCQPMSYFWDMWDGEHVGRCINIYAMAWAHAIINIALDVWMLALPASQVWGLKMPLRRKLGVMVMFGLGIFITIVSCIRLKSLIGFAQAYPQNPTMDFFGVALWSALELTTGVTVACLPATRQVVVKYVPILPEMISRFSSRLGSGLSYIATGGSKSSGGKSELGKSAITTGKSTDIMSRDRTLQRIPTEDPTDNKSIMMKALPPAPQQPEHSSRTLRSPGPEGGGGATRPYSVATTPSPLGDGFSMSVFDGPAGDSASEDVSDAGNDPERGQPAVSPGGPLGPSGTRPWRPMSYPQPRTDRTRWQ